MDVYEKKEKNESILMGNEAIAGGMVDSRCAFVRSYPETPMMELIFLFRFEKTLTQLLTAVAANLKCPEIELNKFRWKHCTNCIVPEFFVQVKAAGEGSNKCTV